MSADSRSARELDERRRALPKVLAFFFVGWTSFLLLDVYTALLIYPDASLTWLGLWRAVGALVTVVAILVARTRSLPKWAITATELGVFTTAGLCLSLDAVTTGGLNSHYLNGLSLVVMVQTIALATRWQRSIVGALVTVSTFPIVMFLASTAVASIGVQWGNVHALATFGVDFMIVLGAAIGCSAGGHIIWAWRRQVFHARRLGRYRLRARIGSGGMGEVWLAWDESLKRDVALKILANEAALKPDAVARFEREALAASALQSPHTIRVFDFGTTDDGVWFMAMEHLAGGDLTALVANHGALPPARVIHFARQACASLVEAHAMGIVHRDIKPGNLFVAQAGDDLDFVKLLDFGIAKHALPDEDGADTRTGWVTGTPAYMSPEMCAGRPADARSDIYSLGAVLYFLVCGHPPFAMANARALMHAHVEEAPVSPSERLGRPVPRDLEEVILRCLAKRPEDRYPRVKDLDLALAACAGPAWTADDAREAWSTEPRPRTPSQIALAEMETIRKPAEAR